MSRPTLEVADIFRTWAGRFIERSRTRVSWPQHKVMRAIERCRTAALGRHRDPLRRVRTRLRLLLQLWHAERHQQHLCE